MYFRNRREAGRLLADKLAHYRHSDVVVFGLPRGGVEPALEVAMALEAPLGLVFSRKIGHPYQPEYAIGAVTENGEIVTNPHEVAEIGNDWIDAEANKQRLEIARRRRLYNAVLPNISAKGKVAILVDDGIATGYTLRAAIKQLRRESPAKVVVAVPVAPSWVADQLDCEADEVVCLNSDGHFLGAVAAYYDDFPQLTDEEVLSLLKQASARHADAVSADPIVLIDPLFREFGKPFLHLPEHNRVQWVSHRFANGELQIELGDHVAHKDSAVIGSIAPPDSNLVEYLFVCDTLRNNNASHITAILPYLAYARQDEHEALRSRAASTIGKLLYAAGVRRLITVDPHSSAIGDLFPFQVTSVSPAVVYADQIRRLGLTHATIVAPDEGAARRARGVAMALGRGLEITTLSKRRHGELVSHYEIDGDVAEECVIIDDILDTGATLISAAEQLVLHGAKHITVMVTHGLFTGDEWRGIFERNVENLYVTDTVAAPAHILGGSVHQRSVSHLVAEQYAKPQPALNISEAYFE
jgi:ribose-phosphate pyrophosphokinase